MTNNLNKADVKHTPGPWSVCQHLKSVECDSACKCGYRGVIFGPDEHVAMAICQPGHDRPQREEEWGTEPQRYPREVEIANAHLIAAAPTLLEALEKFAAYDDWDDTDGVGMMLAYNEAITSARAAIALAKGEKVDG